MMYSAYKLNKQTDSVQHFPILNQSISDCCFLSCIQVSQGTGKVVWYSPPFKNFPQIIVTDTIKGFTIVNEAEVNFFLEFPYFFLN